MLQRGLTTIGRTFDLFCSCSLISSLTDEKSESEITSSVFNVLKYIKIYYVDAKYKRCTQPNTFMKRPPPPKTAKAKRDQNNWVYIYIYNHIYNPRKEIKGDKLCPSRSGNSIFTCSCVPIRRLKWE